MESFETAYILYLIYDGKTALRRSIMSRSHGFPPMSQRISLDGVGNPAETENGVDKAVWKRFAAVDHAMRLLALQFLKHFYALLSNNSLCKLDDYKLLKWNAVKQLQSTAPALQPPIWLRSSIKLCSRCRSRR